LCEKFNLPFIQEVIASAEVIHQLYPQVNTLMDIGGEDAKLIFFDGGQPDIRMNGACAGGTGAFIDQMATLLNVSIGELALASRRAVVFTRLLRAAGCLPRRMCRTCSAGIHPGGYRRLDLQCGRLPNAGDPGARPPDQAGGAVCRRSVDLLAALETGFCENARALPW
jgi:hypothetical protein